ncbi:MAG: polysaccharide pyruvyl transferase family protein [Prevotella sp.]|nr:polysaccharide pyruvyl transferase family protein [Prevotella sp.]
MKIGLLAYHSACNFGATLQLFSTYVYLIKKGHYPIVINWIPADLEEHYASQTPKEQFERQLTVRKELWIETELCRTVEEVASVIEKENIEAVIIGSDAVAQHHPWAERLVFPCKKIIAMRHYTSDAMYPNPYWGVWNGMLSQPIPVAVMSVANQDSAFRFIPNKTKRAMKHSIAQYSYLSVRDSWTRDMMEYLSDGQCIPDITPDPVFAFNQNAISQLPTLSEIREKFQLPEKYILVSLLDYYRQSVTQEWLEEFENIATQHGYICMTLPFSHGKSFGSLSKEIPLPLNAMEWYALIKHSSAYIGNNMHPIIVSLHNQVPFFCFDTYGTTHLNGLVTSDASSKIKHILTEADMGDYRVSCLRKNCPLPTPTEVFDKLQSYDKKKVKAFADDYLSRYNTMMDNILKAFKL